MFGYVPDRKRIRKTFDKVSRCNIRIPPSLERIIQLYLITYGIYHTVMMSPRPGREWLLARLNLHKVWKTAFESQLVVEQESSGCT